VTKDQVLAEFAGFVDANIDYFYRTALLIVWQPSDAEDLVQEALTARRWSRIRSMDHPQAYARILVNLAADGRRNSARRPQAGSLSSASSAQVMFASRPHGAIRRSRRTHRGGGELGRREVVRRGEPTIGASLATRRMSIPARP
jgi:DNA-directed RNA polymerase specialized sigma24 family protein